jgi:hypothetical protein
MTWSDELDETKKLAFVTDIINTLDDLGVLVGDEPAKELAPAVLSALEAAAMSFCAECGMTHLDSEPC